MFMFPTAINRYTALFINFIAKLNIINHIIADVDECSEGTDECTQNCDNTIGSYVCSCNDGFIIDVDRRTCDGEHFIDKFC